MDGVVRERIRMATRGHLAVSVIIDERGRPIGGAWVTARGLPDNPKMRDGLEGALEAEIGRVLARAKRAEIDDDDALEELIQRGGGADLQRRGGEEAGRHGDDQPAGGVTAGQRFTAVR